MNFKFGFVCAAALALFATAAEASATYQFTVNTSSLAGTSGFLEFELGNSGINPFQEATATISNFQSGGGTFANIDPYTSTDPFGFPDVLGNASGILPGTLVLDDNTLAFNVVDYLHPFTFGNSLSFLVTMAGPAVNASFCSSAPAGSGGCDIHDFGFGILDGDENYQFVDPAGDAFLLGGLQVNGNGSVTPYNNSVASALAIAPVPEPAAWTMILAGLGGLVLAFRRRALQ